MDNYHQRYLAEEVAEDHALGLMTRREAIRRLGMMGFSVFGASALLAACGGDDDGDVATDTTASPSTTAASTPTTTGTAGGGHAPRPSPIPAGGPLP